MPSVAELTNAFARHSGIPASRVRSVARRLQDDGLLPLSASRTAVEIAIPHVVALLVAVLADAPLHSVAAATRKYLSFHHDDVDGTMEAGGLLEKVLTGVLDVGARPATDLTRLAMNAAVSVVAGDRPALVVRVGNVDCDPVEWALTATGDHWRPELAGGFQRASSLGGFALFNILSVLGMGVSKRARVAA